MERPLGFITPRHPLWKTLLARILQEHGHIRLPGPLENYPRPRGLADQMVGARPERVVIGAGLNPKVVKREGGRAAWLLVTSTIAATAYLVDTNADGDVDAAKRKMPAVCPANDMGGWMAAARDLCPVLYSGLAIFSTDTTAEVFVGILD